MSRKTKAFWTTVVLGAVLAVAVAESNWMLAAILGAGLVVTLWILTHAYPVDIAPPADRRHENTQRRRAGLKPR
jgi:chromate transport protein ChrA